MQEQFILFTWWVFFFLVNANHDHCGVQSICININIILYLFVKYSIFYHNRTNCENKQKGQTQFISIIFKTCTQFINNVMLNYWMTFSTKK